MNWQMPAESVRHDRTWMAFPREGQTLGDTVAEREAGYEAWAAVANTVAQFESVSILVDPTESSRARRLLDGAITQHEAPIDEFWLRDSGPTFVTDSARPGVLGAVDWIFNGWGDPEWSDWEKAAQHARLVADLTGAEVVSSLMVNEGGGIHVDGEGTVLATQTVQLDPRRNPYADRRRIEDELERTIGATRTVWLPRGLTRDYDDFGTKGHVDIVAAIPTPGTMLLHAQPDSAHPDHEVMKGIREAISQQSDAAGRQFTVVEVPAPAVLRDAHGYVDYSYINHLVVNGGVIACGFGDETADTRAARILQDAYPGREVVTVDARELFARGGGIHCITQQQPAVGPR
ncbi:agmatine deiminase [Subtercola boreus]|uniref:Agmatine deiminase n=1 Tax=Subtercola boreus TaxID=120213 RepID=A0A3E0VAM8_9MICO|nr:agmatine deiminase family protein [Subtercola boreus]RFA06912.1 agmatine deiminase [Subtercola boreus]